MRFTHTGLRGDASPEKKSVSKSGKMAALPHKLFLPARLLSRLFFSADSTYTLEEPQQQQTFQLPASAAPHKRSSEHKKRQKKKTDCDFGNLLKSWRPVAARPPFSSRARARAHTHTNFPPAFFRGRLIDGAVPPRTVYSEAAGCCSGCCRDVASVTGDVAAKSRAALRTNSDAIEPQVSHTGGHISR